MSLLKPIIDVKYYPELRINVNTSYLLHVKVVYILTFFVCENNHVFIHANVLVENVVNAAL